MAVEDRYRTERLHGLEADDLLGILATTLPKYSDAIVVSLDKDLRTIPGRHLNPSKETSPAVVRVITELEADTAWLMQTLMGDSTDGYTGVPGIGPKKAEKILCGRPRAEVDVASRGSGIPLGQAHRSRRPDPGPRGPHTQAVRLR